MEMLSIGSGNIGTFAISTTTSGCAQFSAFGELYSTGTNCGSGSSASTTLLSDTNTWTGANIFNGGATSTTFGATNPGGYYINNISVLNGSTTLNNIFFGGATTSAQITSGTYNYAIGQYAMANATSSPSFKRNFAVGYQALMGSSTATNSGQYNIAIGYQSLSLNSSGSSNNALGFLSLHSNTTGSSNNALGYATLSSNTTGSYNNAIGYDALGANTTGSRNNVLGFATLSSNTTGSSNNAIGGSALNFNTTGTNNNAIGDSALNFNTTGTVIAQVPVCVFKLRKGGGGLRGLGGWRRWLGSIFAVRFRRRIGYRRRARRPIGCESRW